jgi:hypothetical protein
MMHMEYLSCYTDNNNSNWLKIMKLSVLKPLLLAILLTTSNQVLAECKPLVALEGVVSLEQCTAGDSCVSAAEALFQYSTKKREIDDDPTVLNLSLHASPWRLYDVEKRILTIEEVAEMVKPFIAKGVQRIVLKASWTGVSPDRGGKSLATKLSEALGGFPVEGINGFLWIAEDGSTRTTHQAATLFQGGGPYKVRAGREVMVSMVAGWTATLEDTFIKNKDLDGLKDAGAGWDIFFLCPDRALQAFEAAARSNPIAAYNAALMRLERKSEGDLKAAAGLLSQAANAGDKKAQARLAVLKNQHH